MLSIRAFGRRDDVTFLNSKWGQVSEEAKTFINLCFVLFSEFIGRNFVFTFMVGIIYKPILLITLCILKTPKRVLWQTE